MTRNNQFLSPDSASQRLTDADIDKLKDHIKSGEAQAGDLINEIIANSTTFSEKNEFSQAKYVKKKQQK